MLQTEYQKRWYQENKERLRESNRQKYLRNRESVLQRSKARYERMKTDPVFRANRIEKQRERRKERARWWRELKSEMQCSECDESRSPCLDFHHVDPKEKEFNPGNAVAAFVSKKCILEELKKCIVLCANCHRMHHYNEHT